MAWTHYGNRGTAQNKTSSATLAITPTATIAVGRLLIIWTAWDSHRGTPYPISGTTSIEQTKVTDSQGNIYVQLASQGAAEDGTHVRAGLFISRIRTQLTASDTVTITSKTAVDAKSASMHEFGSTLTGWVFYEKGQDADPVWRTANGDVPNLVLASMVSQSYLLLHLLAVEGPDTDAYTWDGDYTQITGTGTTGGADAENVHIRGSYRIATLTGDTLSITSDTADRDLSHGLWSLAEVDIPSGSQTFPEYGLLDNANRANENPLSGGGWWIEGAQETAPGAIANADLKVDGNEIKVAGTHVDAAAKYFWQDDIPCAYSEAWATLSAVPSASIEDQPTPLPDTNPGHRGIMIGIGKPDGFAGSDLTAAVRLIRLGKFQVDDLLLFYNPTSGDRKVAFVGSMTAGMRIGVQQIAGRYYHAYIDQNLGNGWEWLMCIDWGNLALTRPQRPFLQVAGTESAADNFGGGHRCFGPKIIRRLGG